MPEIELMPAGASLWTSGADAVVVTVNCRGAMGAGLAKDCARLLPSASRVYRDLARRGEFDPGGLFHAHATADMKKHGLRWVFFMATKNHWRDPSQLDWIRGGLDRLTEALDPDGGRLDVDTLAIPALGCGWGELRWADVRPLITAAARRMFCAKRVLVFEPHGTERRR